MAAVVGVRPNIRIEIQNNVSESMEVDNEIREGDADMEDGEISDKNEVPQLNDPVTGTVSKPVNLFHPKGTDDSTNNVALEEMPGLLNSLGLSDADKNIRFDVLHMRGTENMVLEDIYKYFRNYEPTFVEWITTDSCNVIFHSSVTAAKALYFNSKVIKGTDSETPVGKSILLINREREVELQGEDMVVLSNNDDDSVNISDIPPVPEGRWRFGNEHPKAKCIFIRFAFQTDRKQPKLINSEYEGVIGLLSESRKRKIKGIFGRNKEIHKTEEDSKNPWGDLAENWYTNESIEEPPLMYFKPVVKQDVLESQKYDVLNRLGVKRTSEVDDDASEDQENKKKSKVRRMCMYADEEEAKVNRRKRLMAVKMFTQNRDETNRNVPDLRNIIRTATKIKQESEERDDHHSDNSDLGKKLKNRLQKNHNISHKKPTTDKPPLRPENQWNDRHRDEQRKIREHDRHIREREKQLDNFRNKSPPVLQKHTENRHKKEVSPPHRKSGGTLKHNYDKSKYKNKMHSDKHNERERHRRHRRSPSTDYKSKRKSIVSVVVKKQKRPVVASTVWSRVENSKRERLKTASERLKSTRDDTSSSESTSENSSSTSTSSSSSENSSSESSSESEEDVVEQVTQAILKGMDRPGFKTSSTQSIPIDHYKKSPLRIEISNEHFRN